MLILAMPGMPDLVTRIYASSPVSGLLEKYLDVPIFRYSDPLSDQTASSSPQSSPSASITADTTAGCSESSIVGVRASGYEGNPPQNTLDKNFNTRWGDYGVGKWIQ